MTAVIRSHLRFLSAAALLLVLAGCRRDGLVSGRADGLAPELITVPGASRVRSARTPEVERLTYRVDVDYPARAVVEQISRELAARGWQPVENNFFNRANTASYMGGWIEYPAAEGRFIRQWWSQWVDKGGTVIDYSLSYTTEAKAAANRSELEVVASRMSPATAVAIPRMSSDGLLPLRMVPAGTEPNWRAAGERGNGG